MEDAGLSGAVGAGATSLCAGALGTGPFALDAGALGVTDSGFGRAVRSLKINLGLKSGLPKSPW